jgi:hypothetical protein
LISETALDEIKITYLDNQENKETKKRKVNAIAGSNKKRNLDKSIKKIDDDDDNESLNTDDMSTDSEFESDLSKNFIVQISENGQEKNTQPAKIDEDEAFKTKQKPLIESKPAIYIYVNRREEIKVNSC